MGGLSVGLVEISSLTSKNPASYMNLDSLMVNFQVSMLATYSKLQEKQQGQEVSMNTNSASLGQISFAFPITSYLKSSFGLTPLSDMGYNVVRERDGGPNVGRYILNNHGNGGLNQVFLGLATGTKQLSVGANFNYQFGTFSRYAETIFADSILLIPRTTELHRYLDATGFFVDLGLQYKQPISNRYQLGFGFAFTPKYNLNASRSILELSTIHGVGSVDTTFSSDAEKGTLKMPDKYTFGLSFERLNRWVVGVEFTMVNFNNYAEFGYRDSDLSNAHTFRTGLEFKGRRLDNNLLNRMSYRFGYHYGTNYVAFHDSKLNQYGVSFGLGMPIRRSLSRIDLAVEFGRKGNMNNGQIQENYGRIVLGISAFDRWFVRGKFD
jgi:hypothetical protein